MNILILGATGFIGSEVARRLDKAGHAVIGLGRDPDRARRMNQSVKWLRADLNALRQAADWTPLLDNVDIVVNCAGALQDGLCDDVAATQQHAMMALYDAAASANVRLVVQISANTQGAAASTGFLATKRAADEALKRSGLAWVILRPALVIGRNAYGGTALLRALAALPVVTPLVHSDRPVAIVALADVAEAVALAVDGTIVAGSDLDLAADAPPTLAELVAAHRQWLGLPPNKTLRLPAVLARPISFLADIAGHLGWRSPLRSTAMTVMTEGVTTSGSRPPMPLRTLGQTLASAPSGVQDLWFARLYLAKPVILVVLAAFWILSGVIPFFTFETATAYFKAFMPRPAANTLTAATSLLDIALGLLTLYRPRARQALIGQIGLASAYLIGGTLLAPALWADPLGPYVKILPAILLSLAALAILEER
jgi:uncharacterized protein YbjT (DUF2867 family)